MRKKEQKRYKLALEKLPDIANFHHPRVKVLALIDKKITPFQMSIISMMPRGLAAAVLASMPLATGINIQYFPEIVFS